MRRNFITRKFEFDAGHRVMHERLKCFNLHGHRYIVEMTFSYLTAEQLGYAIDFKEIKRIGCQWIDDTWDHAFIANPKDTLFIEACRTLNNRLYLMKLVDDDGYCNPSAENMAKELFFAMKILLNQKTDTGLEDYNLMLESIRLYETPNCWIDCNGLSQIEENFLYSIDFYTELLEYRRKKGTVEYDERKL